MEKRYDHKQVEPDIQQLWEHEQTYAAKNNPGPIFSIDTPPPTVSGALHIGHICSYTQTDIIARYQRMSGNSVFYPFGFDDNGLPTERYVEKKLKIRAHELSRSELIKTCLTVTQEVEADFKSLWQQVGLSVDWSICYSTISDDVRKIAQESFIQLYNKGFVYRKDEPALYCATCRTSVAQAELDDAEKPSYFNDIVFKSHDGKDLIIGTTRPELLPSTVALLYNPDDERYQHLKGTTATVPLFGQEVPVLQDEKVDIEKGTGLVMVSTFGDTTDIEWFKKFKLPYKPSIGLNGKLLPHTGILAGLKVPEARKKVLEALQDKGLLLRQKEISHIVNLHERCKKPVEIIALPQWFLNILDSKETFLQLADQINWYPAYMKTRYRDWVQNLNWDWCLSRQRFYGIPFPAWHCKNCNTIVLAPVDSLPIDPQETAFPGGACTNCGGSDLTPDTDIMDTWNCSSLTPQILYSYFAQQSSSPFTDKNITDFIPMSMRPQAHDIIRTWAFYTIVKSWMHHQSIPWKDIVISGHVLSNKQEKLSKSQGNAAIAPKTLLQTYAADAIRYWTASGTLGKDIAFSETQIKIGQKLITKLWNAFRFISMHIESLEDTQQPENLGTVNNWICHRATECFASYKRHLDAHEFNLALSTVETFFWKQFCDNYLELIKDQLFNPDNYNNKQVQATRWTLHHVGLRILQLYAPYQPHVTESIYQELYKQSIATPSLHQTRFIETQKQHSFAYSVQIMELVLTAVAQVRKLKTEHALSLGAELAQLHICSQKQEILDQLKPHTQLLRGATRAQEIIFEKAIQEKATLETSETPHSMTISLKDQCNPLE